MCAIVSGSEETVAVMGNWGLKKYSPGYMYRVSLLLGSVMVSRKGKRKGYRKGKDALPDPTDTVFSELPRSRSRRHCAAFVGKRSVEILPLMPT